MATEKKKELLNKIQAAINESEDTLKNELTAFFGINPPDSVKGLDTENAKRQIEKEVNKILARLELPDAAKLISNIKLYEMYYELTWEDLNDEKFKKWFTQIGLINEADNSKIASFENAFTIKK